MISLTNAQKDLVSQQEKLSSIDYDLRISNLAQFIHKKIQKNVESAHTSLRFIDVGAGNGLFLKYFKRLGYSVSGIELEKDQVEMMKKDPQLKGVPLSQGDITKKTGKEEYDIVIASDVIEHIEDDEKALRNLWTYVAPGGLLIITVPAHMYLYGKRDKAWGHFRRYSKNDLLKKINKNIPQTKYKVTFATFWNFVGFFAYGFYEKILQKQINENMRYSNSGFSKSVRNILDRILKSESAIGGTPIGLTLIVGVKKYN